MVLLTMIVNRWPTIFSYLCTYDLYGPVRNVFDACRYIRGQVERGWTLEIKSFLGHLLVFFAVVSSIAVGVVALCIMYNA
jgi:hypothetical protein